MPAFAYKIFENVDNDSVPQIEAVRFESSTTSNSYRTPTHTHTQLQMACDYNFMFVNANTCTNAYTGTMHRHTYVFYILYLYEFIRLFSAGIAALAAPRSNVMAFHAMLSLQ